TISLPLERQCSLKMSTLVPSIRMRWIVCCVTQPSRDKSGMGPTRSCNRNAPIGCTPQLNDVPSWPEIKDVKHLAAQSQRPIAISTILRLGLTVDQRTKTTASPYVHSIMMRYTKADGLFENTMGSPSSNRPDGLIRPSHYSATPIGTPKINTYCHRYLMDNGGNTLKRHLVAVVLRLIWPSDIYTQVFC